MADSYFNIACKELKNVNKDVSKDPPISDGFSWYTVNIALINFSVIVNGCRERPRTPHAILCFCTCFSIRFLVCFPYFRDFFPGIKGNSLTRVLVLNVPSFSRRFLWFTTLHAAWSVFTPLLLLLWRLQETGRIRSLFVKKMSLWSTVFGYITWQSTLSFWILCLWYLDTDGDKFPYSM